MVTLSFSYERFIGMILAGDPWLKDQTIRPFSAVRMKVLQRNQTLQLYFKQRAPGGFRFGTARRTEVFPVKLAKDGVISDPFPLSGCSQEHADAFARRDGFEDYSALYALFCEVYGAERVAADDWLVIRWTDARRWFAPGQATLEAYL